MGKTLTLTASDGHKFSAYRADPAGKPKGGLVVIQEIFGVLKDVAAAIKAVADAGKVGIVGYCWGGSVAWRAATQLSGLSAAVGYYGGQIAEFKDEKPKVPVMLNFGETDASIPLADVEKIKAAQPKVPIHVYPGAGHGFSCDHRGSFHKASHDLALKRTMEFFAKNVG